MTFITGRAFAVLEEPSRGRAELNLKVAFPFFSPKSNPCDSARYARSESTTPNCPTYNSSYSGKVTLCRAVLYTVRFSYFEKARVLTRCELRRVWQANSNSLRKVGGLIRCLRRGVDMRLAL